MGDDATADVGSDTVPDLSVDSGADRNMIESCANAHADG